MGRTKMLSIELHEANNFAMSGSGVLTALQNENTPKADLLVRESIQNSLDAAREDKDFVDVDLIVSTFQSSALKDKIESLGETLSLKYPGENKYLAIRDKWTVGLNGPLHRTHLKDEKAGNIIKLIYEIAKPQVQEGAGGSWGYGKTIFYRMGIGLVFYYSRIKKENNEYEERLAAVMVEDENSSNSIIPAYNNSQKTGVAWWGEKIGENKTQPIRDSKTIHSILDVFSIAPYIGDETGTTVIIPFIDENEILKHNEMTSANEKQTHELYENLADFLEISVQRWYTPRLNNKRYRLGNRKYLLTSINGERLQAESQDEYFRIIKDMYNYALNDNQRVLEVIKDESQLTREIISLNNTKDTSLEETTVGYLVHGKFTYEQLAMPRAKSPISPHFLSNIEQTNTEFNSPIVTFCRQPGMLINYESVGSWANALPTTNKEEYILVIFVLNSNNTITFKSTSADYSLEEYIRKGEEGDHLKWADHPKFGVNGKIVSRIQNHVNSKVKKTFEKEVKTAFTDNDGKLSNLAGNLILPPKGFGKKATKNSTRSTIGGGGSITRSTRTVKTSILNHSMKFFNEGVEIPLEFDIKSSIVSEITIDLEIKLDNRSSTLDRYEETTGFASPLEIASIHLINNQNQSFSYNLEETDFEVYKSAHNKVYRLVLKKKYFPGEKLTGKIVLKSTMKELAPVLRLKSKENVKVKS